MTENRSNEPPGTIAVLIPALNEEDVLPPRSLPDS